MGTNNNTFGVWDNMPDEWKKKTSRTSELKQEGFRQEKEPVIREERGDVQQIKENITEKTQPGVKKEEKKNKKRTKKRKSKIFCGRMKKIRKTVLRTARSCMMKKKREIEETL